MARTGMANPILKLRQLANAGTADYALAGVTFWSDDQLQTILDQHREDIFSQQLESVSTVSGGTSYSYDYYSTPGDYEEGTPFFQVTDSQGNAVTPVVNYGIGHMSFGTVSQGGTVYYLTGRSFDINAAAAHVWKSKASHVADAYDFSVDGHSMNRSQLSKQYMEMAKLYSSQAKVQSVQMVRGDYGRRWEWGGY